MTNPARITKESTIQAKLGTIAKLTQLLGAREASEVMRLAKRTSVLERRWVSRARLEVAATVDRVLEKARETGRLSFANVDFSPLMMEHARDIMREGIDSTHRMEPVRTQHLAAPPKGAVPKSLKALREWWDAYQKTGRVPARQKEDAEKLRKAFLEAIQKAWRENSEDFLSGDTARNTEAVAAIKRQAKVPAARAKMIVETETTYYFNRVRREVYDKSADVSHYLFVAIRDAATTPWCKSRDGLVYAKGDPLLDKETPPCHWYCRSELLPLTPQNQNHAALINDKSVARRHNRPKPLPEGWTGAR